MNGREMLNALNAKLVAVESKNAELETRLAEVKAIAEAARDKADAVAKPKPPQ